MDPINAGVHKSTELILKKTMDQKTEIVSENSNNKETLKIENTTSTKTSDNTHGNSLRERTINEANLIAEEVYKIIEKRLAIEKDRRGMF